MWLFWLLLALPVAVGLLALFSPKAPEVTGVAEEQTRIRLCCTDTPVMYWTATVLYDEWGQPWIAGDRYARGPAIGDYPVLWRKRHQRKSGVA